MECSINKTIETCTMAKVKTVTSDSYVIQFFHIAYCKAVAAQKIVRLAFGPKTYIDAWFFSIVVSL